MNIIDRFQRSWAIFMASLQLIRQQPRLLLFPLLSSLFVLVLAGFFLAVPVAVLASLPTGHAFFEAAHWKAVFAPHFADRFRDAFGGSAVTLSFFVYGSVLYLVSMFAACFCNVAFYHQITRAFAGDTVSIAEGYRFALTRWVAILKWSLLAATVGIIIRAVAERTGLLGSLIMRLVGTAWSVATVFTIPLLVREDCRQPVKLLRNSVALLRQTWGEALIGYVGMGMITGLVVLLLLGAVFLSIFLMVVTKSVALLVTLVVALLLVLFAYALVMNVANDIYRCALYIFASEGEIPGTFDRDMLDAAWKMKKA